MWAAGELTRALFTLVLHRSLFPSPADFLYLAFVVLVCVAFVQFPAEPTQGSRTRVLFDALIVAVSLFVVLWVAVLGNVYEATRVDSVIQGPRAAVPAVHPVHASWPRSCSSRDRVTGNSVVMWLLLGAVTLMAFSGVTFAFLQGLPTAITPGTSRVLAGCWGCRVSARLRC